MEQLYQLLNTLKDSTGDFACSGFLPELCLPGLVIDNVGHISLPVQVEQAQKIIEVAKKAPYGLGAKTLVDETVRKTWQLDPKQITIKNEHFLAGVENVVSSVKKHLGCDKKAVKANLYKILLYETGGHFKAHRDTEKDKGMFATMVIQLPSKFEGGKITVRHAGNEKTIEMDGDRSAYCCKYAAHYSDCEHEVSEIASGYRLAIVYSLCWTARGAPPSADTGPAIVRKISKVLPEICTGKRNLFSWFLSHKYSESGLSGSGIDALKGADDVVARALQQANELLPEEQQYEFYIAEIKRELQQFGDFWDEDSWEGGFQPNGDEEEEVNIEDWLGFDGEPAELDDDIVGDIELDIENDVVNFQRPRSTSTKDAIQQLWGTPDDEENTGPSGNEGATQTYWYNNYAIFAWQKGNKVHLRCKLNGYLSAVKWVSKKLTGVEKQKTSSPAYKEAMAELKMVIDYAVSNNVSLSCDEVYSMLKTLSNLRTEAVALTKLFISDVMGKVVDSGTSTPYGLGDSHLVTPLVELTATLRWPSISEAIKKLFDLSPVSQHGSWAEFLKSLFQRNQKKVFQKDACFKAMVKCLAEKVEADGQKGLLEHADRVGKIATLLFVIGEVDILAKFTDVIQAYCQQSHENSLLENLIRFLEKEKLSGNQFWNRLLHLRIARLEDIEKAGIPPFTWNQDEAVINDHPQVQTFLRGPNRTMKYQAFSGIAPARQFATTHFGSSWVWSGRDTTRRSYSAEAKTAGTGRHAHVLIEKTRAWYDRKFAPIQRQLDELKKLRSMVNPASVATASAETEGPQAKKRAVGVALLSID